MNGLVWAWSKAGMTSKQTHCKHFTRARAPKRCWGACSGQTSPCTRPWVTFNPLLAFMSISAKFTETKCVTQASTDRDSTKEIYTDNTWMLCSFWCCQAYPSFTPCNSTALHLLRLGPLKRGTNMASEFSQAGATLPALGTSNIKMTAKGSSFHIAFANNKVIILSSLKALLVMMKRVAVMAECIGVY